MIKTNTFDAMNEQKLIYELLLYCYAISAWHFSFLLTTCDCCDVVSDYL